MRFFLCLLLVAGALVAPAAANANPPGNDHRKDAWTLTNGASGTTAEATREPDSMIEGYRPGNGTHSVWYRWTAPAAGRLSVQVNAPSFDSVVAVYTTWQQFNNGDVVSDADTGAGDTSSRVEIYAKAGQTFHIVVDGVTASGAGAYSFATSWDTTPPPPANDDFANAQPLAAAANPIYDWTDFNHRYATKQAGEPSHRTQGTGKSVWFKWTAPSNGMARVVGGCGDADLESTNTTVAVYVGSAVNALSEVVYEPDTYTGQCTFDGVRFKAVAGMKFMIAVDNASADTGYNRVRLDFDNVAPKVSFAAATVFGAGQSVGWSSDEGYFEDATYECKLDNGPIKACTSGQPVGGLTQGSHTLAVRATDDMGMVGAWAAKTFTVDKTPAVATITGGPEGAIGTTKGQAFTFTSEPGATFKCRYEKYAAYKPCTSPFALPENVQSTTWEFGVIATDPYGNAQPVPSTRAFSVDHKLLQPKPATPVVTPPAPKPPVTSTTTPRTTTTASTTSAPWTPTPPRLLVRRTTLERSAIARRGVQVGLRCGPRNGCMSLVKLRLGQRVVGSVLLTRTGWFTLKLSKAGAKAVRRTKARRLTLTMGERTETVATIRLAR